MKNYLNIIIHKIRLFYKGFFLKNRDMTIICNNCIGGILYSDYKIQFKSPTINLWMTTEDYLKFINNLNFYQSQSLIQVDKNREYPVAKLYDIIIYFMHYSTFEEAKKSWERRIKRMNQNNMCFIMVQSEDCGENEICDFINLPYKNKILFLNYRYNHPNTFYIKGFEENNALGNIIQYDSHRLGYRYYEQFDFVDFFNKMIIE